MPCPVYSSGMPDPKETRPDRRTVVYTRTGDDGTTGLLFGGRVGKDSAITEACGAVDEAQAAIGVARAAASGEDGPLEETLIAVSRDLWVLMAELATDATNQTKLRAGTTLVTSEMVSVLERRIDEVSSMFDPPTEFVVPGSDPVSAHLDLARTVVRRAERRAVAIVSSDSVAATYLNRLSDLLWTLARRQEGTALRVRDLN